MFLKGLNSMQFQNYCSGGCGSKLGPDFLSSVLQAIPRQEIDERLVIGYDSSDDAAVYKISDDTAIIQTLDFFPPMVADPYLFGKIAAANALSDVYAMGGEVVLALNIVGFPEKLDKAMLGEILRGGAEKVAEAGGMLAGGHSIHDENVKYGMSVMGRVHPERIMANNTGKVGDALILTKPLGVGIITTAHNVGETTDEAYERATHSMQTLNKYAAQVMQHFDVHACTDITGFGFLGHLREMLRDDISAAVDASQVPCFSEALDLAAEFITTKGGQRNRNFVGEDVRFEDVSFAMQEVLLDPQTSGGLLIAVAADEADKMLAQMQAEGVQAGIVGHITEARGYKILVSGGTQE